MDRANLRFVEVMHMVAPTSNLFHPDISLRVLQLVVRDLLNGPPGKAQDQGETTRAATETKQGASDSARDNVQAQV